MKIWTDAQVFRNGSPDQEAYCAAVIDDGTEHGGLLFDNSLGHLPVNMSEYSGVIEALEWARSVGVSVEISTDSKNVYSQLVGLYKVDKLIDYYRKALRLLKDTNSTIIWEPREVNKAGHYYEKKLKNMHTERRLQEVEADDTK